MGREKKNFFPSLQNLQKRLGSSIPPLPSRTAASQPVNGGGSSCDSPVKNSLSVRGAGDKAGRGTPGRPAALASRLPGKSRRNNRQFTFAASQPGWHALKGSAQKPILEPGRSDSLEIWGPVCPLGQPQEAEGIKSRPLQSCCEESQLL